MTNTAAPTTTAPTFETGQTYNCSWPTDHTMTTPQLIVKRTAKFLTIRDAHDGRVRRVGVKVDQDGTEWALPFGTYPMAATLKADRPFDRVGY